MEAAEVKLDLAQEAVKACETMVATLTDDRAKAQAELDKVEALDQVSQAQHVTESNLKRKIRKLSEQIEIAQAALVEAEKVRADAAHGVVLAKWDAAVAEHAELSRAFIQDVTESAARLAEKRDAYHAKDVELRALGLEVDPIKPRSAPSTLADLAHWDKPALVGAQAVFDAVRVHNLASLPDPNEAARNRPYQPYRPPRDENGRWTDPRPEPPHLRDLGVWRT